MCTSLGTYRITNTKMVSTLRLRSTIALVKLGHEIGLLVESLEDRRYTLYSTTGRLSQFMTHGNPVNILPR